MKKFEVNQIFENLKKFPSWKYEFDVLTKEFKFNTYLEGVKFLSEIANLSEKLNHHPDLLLTYKKLNVKISTHDVNGISELDFEFISEIEKNLKFIDKF